MTLLEVIESTTQAAQSAYKSGYDIGFREGFAAAMVKAQQMVKEAFPVFPIKEKT